MDRFLKRQIADSPCSSSSNSNSAASDTHESHYDTRHESDTDEDNSNKSDINISTPKKRRFNNYKQMHKVQWEQEFKWLVYDQNLKASYCKVCSKCVTSKITHIRRHNESVLHKKNVNKALKTPTLDNFGINNQMNCLQREARKAEYKCIMFLHEHNMPFLLMDHFPKFLRAVLPDSKIAKEIECSRTKATQLTTDCIMKEAQLTITNGVNNQMYSLIVDESTDIATQKSLVILIRYWDNSSNAVKDKFLSLVKLNSCTADNIFKSICEVLKENNIETKNLIGFGADNAAVMLGQHQGVQAKLKELNSKIFVLGCTCHSIHLCASAAALKLPKSVEELARSIFNYFSNSSNRAEGLKEFQIFTNIKPCKMLHPSQTRWLSLQAVVDRVLHSWDALKLYFTNAVHIDNLHSSTTIMDNLYNPIFKLYFMFLSYVLDLVNKLNKEFQSESPKIHILLKRVTELYTLLLRNYIDKKYIVDIQKLNPEHPHIFLPLEKMYFGAKVELFLSSTNINESEVLKFKKNALLFYVELAVQIKKRFKFDDPLLIFLNNFDPKIATTGEINSIVSILNFFPNLDIEIEELNNEWRLLSVTEEICKNKDKNFIEFWSYVINLKNELNLMMFPNLSTVIKCILSLPHSSACAERIFSELTLLKTKLRN